MSAPDHEAPESRGQHRPALTVLMVAAGVVLLFPGLCSLFFIFALFGDDFKDALNDAGFAEVIVAARRGRMARLLHVDLPRKIAALGTSVTPVAA